MAGATTTASGAVDVLFTQTHPPAIYSFETGIVELDLASGRRRWLVADGPADEPSLSADGTVLAFARDGIWVADADGSKARKIVNEEFAAWPAVSPDGHRVAYIGDAGLYVVDSDGSEKRRLHPRGAVPSWSPDGRQLVFDDRTRIYVIDADGTDARPLTNPGRDGNDDEPAWSPDGRSIAFARDGELQVVSAKGGQPRRLTRTTDLESSPAWSPDSTSLVFERRGEIHSLSVAGGSSRRITRNDIDEYEPVWGPRGRTIVFEASPDSEIFVLREGRQRPLQLTENDVANDAVAWSSSGRRIAFSSSQRGRPGVYTSDPGGRRPRLLARVAGNVHLEWSPDDDRLLAVSWNGTWVIDVASGATRRVAAGGVATWSPSGREVAYVVGASLYVVGADGRNRRRVSTIARFDGETDGWPQVDWSPRGAIAFVVAGRRDLKLRIVSTSGAVLRNLIGLDPAWSPNGGSLAFTIPGPNGEIGLYRVGDRSVRRLRLGGHASSPRWTRDGQDIVVRRDDGIWQAPVAGGPPVRLVQATRVGAIAVH